MRKFPPKPRKYPMLPSDFRLPKFSQLVSKYPQFCELRRANKKNIKSTYLREIGLSISKHQKAHNCEEEDGCKHRDQSEILKLNRDREESANKKVPFWRSPFNRGYLRRQQELRLHTSHAAGSGLVLSFLGS